MSPLVRALGWVAVAGQVAVLAVVVALIVTH